MIKFNKIHCISIHITFVQFSEPKSIYTNRPHVFNETSK